MRASPSIPEYAASDCPLSPNDDFYVLISKHQRDKTCVDIYVLIFLTDCSRSINVNEKLNGLWRLDEE